MLPDSLIEFIKSESKEWPQWLPVIVHDLGNTDNLRIWNPLRDIGIINKGEHEPDEEVIALRQRVVEAGFQIGQLWNKLSNLPLEERVEASFRSVSEKPNESNDDLRGVLLNFIFMRPKEFADSIIEGHLESFPQKDPRYPLIARRTDDPEKPLVLIPKPEEHWRHSRVNVMKQSGKIWFPTHKKMKQGHTSVNTLPPRFRKDAKDSHGLATQYSYLPNDNCSPLTWQRGHEDFTSGPNVVHWDHEFHSEELEEVFDKIINYLRESKFIPDRPDIIHSGTPDLEIGRLEVLVADKNALEMIAIEDAFKLPSLLNTAYMPKICRIEDGFEDSTGKKRKIHEFIQTEFHGSERYSFFPSSNLPHLKEGMEEWNKHIFNWNIKENRPRREVAGRIPATNWENRIEAEGCDENFNYSVLIRDLRTDNVLLEMAMRESSLISMALDINRPVPEEESRIRGPESDGVWVFEGYWSRSESAQKKRELRFEEIPQIETNLVEQRYVNGEKRVTQKHPAFADFQSRKLVGFSEKSRSRKLSSKDSPRALLELLPDNWIPCLSFDDESAKIFSDIDIELIQVGEKTLDWVLDSDFGKRYNPWTGRLGKICEQVKETHAHNQRVLLGQVEMMLERATPLGRGMKQKLKGIDSAIINDFPVLSKLSKGVGTSLSEATRSVLMKSGTLSGNEVIKEFKGVSLCNWIYDRENSKFIASDETGLENRRIFLITPEKASELFGWNSDSHPLNLSSEGEWYSMGYGLDNEAEMVILHDRIITKIENEENISRIEAPSNLEQLRGANLVGSSPKFQFIGSILTLDYFTDQVQNKGTALDLISETLRDRSHFSIVDADIAEQKYGLTAQGALSTGPGGWNVVGHEDGYILLHGKMPDLLFSLTMLRKLLAELGIPEDVLSFQTDRIGSVYGKRLCKDLIKNEPEKEDYIEALLETTHEQPFLVGSPSPWSYDEEERRQYGTRFTLDNPRGELDKNKNDWYNQRNAKTKLSELQDQYKTWVENITHRTKPNPSPRGLIEAMYHGRLCILDGKQNLSSDSDDTIDITYPRFRVSISKNLIGNSPLHDIALQVIDQHELMPDTLIASGDAMEKLRRTENQVRLDFVEDFYTKMMEVVHSDHWDRTGDWVLTDSVLISPQQDMVGIWLHKLHHLHITALYTTLSGMER